MKGCLFNKEHVYASFFDLRTVVMDLWQASFVLLPAPSGNTVLHTKNYYVGLMDLEHLNKVIM